MFLWKYHILHFLIILLWQVKVCWSEVCSSVVEDITLNQCNPNQRSSNTVIDSTNVDLVSTKSCSHFIENVSYRVVHTEHGIINYHIVLPPASCRYTRYMFKLVASNASLCTHIDEISSGRVQSDAIRSDYADEMGVKNVRVTLGNDTDSCSNDLDLTFEYVSTQCYQLVVQPFISHDSQIQLYSNWHSIQTKYKPVHPHLFVPQFDWRHDQLENSVTVRLIIHSDLTMRPLASCVEIMSGVDAAGQHACYESGNRMSQCLVWFGNTDGDASLHRCDKEREQGASRGVSRCASATENELVCSVENVTAGNYCVVMRFLDERCQGSESACSWHKMFVVNNRSATAAASPASLFPPSASAPVSTPLLLLLALLLLLGVFALLLLHSCDFPSLRMRRYKHLMLPLSLGRGGPGPEGALEERPVLLLYARDCEPVARVLGELKTLLRRAGQCQVLDFWDVEHFNSVARNPMAWLNSHLSNEKMSVIIVNTPLSQLLLQNQMPLEKHNGCPPLPEPTSYLSAQSKNLNVNIDNANAFNAGGSLSISMNGVSHGGRRDTNIDLDDPGPRPGAHDAVSVLSQRLEAGNSTSPPDDQCTPLLSEGPAYQASIVTSNTRTFRVNVKYKQSKCFDSLFAAGLMSVAQQCAASPSRKLTERVHIVGFDSDVQSLCSSYLLPMTLTRFILPQHTENLLYHIHSLSPLSRRFTLDSSEDYHRLKLSIDLMLKFRRSQPDYLLDLLVNVV